MSRTGSSRSPRTSCSSQKLSEYHTGLRAFSSDLLASLPIERNSDDFVFDNQIIAQAVAAGARIGELSCPTRYMDEASSINLRRSIAYGIGVLRTSADYWLYKRGLRSCEYLDFNPQDMVPRQRDDSRAASAGAQVPGQASVPVESPAPSPRGITRAHQRHEVGTR